MANEKLVGWAVLDPKRELGAVLLASDCPPNNDPCFGSSGLLPNPNPCFGSSGLAPKMDDGLGSCPSLFPKPKVGFASFGLDPNNEGADAFEPRLNTELGLSLSPELLKENPGEERAGAFAEEPNSDPPVVPVVEGLELPKVIDVAGLLAALPKIELLEPELNPAKGDAPLFWLS